MRDYRLGPKIGIALKPWGAWLLKLCKHFGQAKEVTYSNQRRLAKTVGPPEVYFEGPEAPFCAFSQRSKLGLRV